MSYVPGQVSSDPGDLSVFLSDELDKIAAALDQGTFRNLEFINVAPEKPRSGMVRGADGTNWNPSGQGRGIYAYYGGQWNKLIDIASTGTPDGSITTAKIAPFAVTGPKIADLSVNTAKLADLAVSLSKLQDAAVTTAKIADDAVQSAKIADLAVTKAKVAALSIDASKLVIASVGAALNPDPNFVDPSAWVFPLGSATFPGITDGAVGTTALRTALSTRTKWQGNQRIPIDQTKVYRVRMLVRNVGTAAGVINPYVNVLDAAGSTIDGSDNDPATLTTEWYEFGLQVILAGSAWTQLIAVFGAASARTFINAAKTMVCGCDANLSSGVGVQFEFQDARIEEVVNSTLIADGAISTAKIAANAITAVKIASHTITAAQIAAATISATEIAANTITAAKIAAGTITANEIAAATITGNKLVADTITANEIAASAITASELAAASVIAGKIATNAIVAGDGVIANLAVANAQIASATISGAKIASATITGANIASATIASAHIGSLEVKTANIDTLSVTTIKVADANITTPKLAANAATSENSTSSSASGASGAGTTDLLSIVVTVTGEQLTVVGIANLNKDAGGGPGVDTSNLDITYDGGTIVSGGRFSVYGDGSSVTKTFSGSVSLGGSITPAAGTYTFHFRIDSACNYTSRFLSVTENKR